MNLKSQKTFSFGHQVNFKQYANEDGFYSTGMIQNLFQDSKGRIWICAQDGLSMFDSHTFYYFTSRDGFDLYNIGAVCEDNKGGIWVGTSKGLFLYKEKRFQKIDTAGGKMPKGICLSLFKDNDGTIWAGTYNGLYHFNPEKIDKPFIRKYMMPGNELSNYIHLIKRKKNNQLFVGTENGCFIYKLDTFVRSKIAGGYVYSHLDFKNNQEYTSGWGNPMFRHVNDKTDTIIDVGSGVLSIAKDKQDNIWLATWDKGVYKFNGKDLINYSHAEGLYSNSFWSSLSDREGNIWFGASEKNLYKYTGEAFTSINEKNGLYSKNIKYMAIDTSNNVWFASDNSISFFNENLKTITNYTSCNGVPISLINNLIVTKNNEVLALKYGGNGYKIVNGKISNESWLGGFGFLETKSNGYYIGQERGFRHYNKNGVWDSIKIKGILPNSVMDIYSGEKNDLWLINPFYGIGYYNGKKETFFIKKNGFVNNPATCIFYIDNKNIWIGTKGRGVLKCMLLNDSTIKILDSISTTTGLNSDLVNSIHIYNQKMFIGTANGLSVLKMKEYQSGNKKIKTYTAEDGLVNNNCTVAFIDKKGKIWIKTPNGAFIYDPKVESFNKIETQNLITNIQLFNENIDWVSNGFLIDIDGLPIDLTLSYDKNHLTFSFIGICHSGPSKVLYQYKIEGLDKNWSTASKKNEITYSNVPPGTYTFMVKSCNNDGIWNKIPTQFVFKIKPPFWRQTWFYILSFILISCLIFYYMKFRERKLKKENEILEEKINVRTIQLKNAVKEVEEKHKEITDSINYAERIQRSFLATKELLDDVFSSSSNENEKKYFVFFKPKDVVSGDFYWGNKLNNGKFVLVTADSTGHGVPGAIMSILNISSLEKAIEKGYTEPSDILNQTRKTIIERLKKDGSKEGGKDGMDCSLICFDFKNKNITYSAANNPIWVIRKKEIIDLIPDKMPVGKHEKDIIPFTQHDFKLESDDVVYTLTDGLPDQFGGPKGKKFMYKQLKEFLITISDLSMSEQERKINQELINWKGSLEQVDDITLIGVKI